MTIYTHTGDLKDKYLEDSLDKLELSWNEEDLPQRLRTRHVHKLHPYLGKFIPQLVEIFLHRFFSPGDVILDPFAGSGTTLVESLAFGASSIGIDIAVFNCLMMKVKTSKYDIEKLQKEAEEIYQRTERACQQNKQKYLFKQKEIDVENMSTDSGYLNKWYVDSALKQLLVYRSFIHEYRYQDVLKLILSRSARSARNIKHYELDKPKAPVKGPYYCKKHRRECYPVTDALKFLKQYTSDTIDRIKKFDKIRGDGHAIIIQGDSRSCTLDQLVTGIITSPPYVGNIDYHEQHIYAYELLNLPRRDEKEIGPKFRGKSKKAREKYANQITEAFRNVSQYVKTHGKIIIVANDKFNLFPSIIERSGLTLENVLTRSVNRRTGRRGDGYSEQIFIAVKL